MEVYDETGRRLSLRDTGKSGGEGSIYLVDGVGWAAKVYHHARGDARQHDKVRAMVASPPRDPSWEGRRHRSIAWAEHLLYHDPARTRFAGFTMPAIDTSVFREAHCYFDHDDRVRRFGGGFTWRHLLTAACNLASAVAAVHAEGHRVGDLRETNVLVAPSALICLIDCDSFQIRDPANGTVHRTRVGSAEYLPRELHGVSLADHDRTYADRFALAVLIFKFLMNGVHPFQARGRLVEQAGSTEAKILLGAFPYGRRRRGLEPPAFAPPYDVLPPSVRALFKRCFIDGHRKPARRPAPEEWFAVLRAESKRARNCRVNENHWYGGHLRSCPWCRASTGSDLFPAPGVTIGAQRALTATTSVVAAAPQQPSPPKQPRARPKLPRVRIGRRAAIAALVATALLVGAFTPLGHASAPPRVRAIEVGATRVGPCPYDGRTQRTAPSWCRARWRIDEARVVERRARMLYVWMRTHRSLHVAYGVTFEAPGRKGCALPWTDNMTFEQQRPEVCLSTCPERIELRARGRTFPLDAAGGLGARAGPLRCNTPYRGSWTFEVAEASGRASLHHPGLRAVALRLPR